MSPIAADQFGKVYDSSPLHPVGPVGERINTVYTPLFWASVVVFTLVSLAIIYAALRFRRRADDEEPVQVHGNNRIELAWTLIPFVILVSLFILTASNMHFITSAPADSMHVCVQGQRFNWSYYYEDSCGDPRTQGTGLTFAPADKSVVKLVTSDSRLYIPVGKPVALEVVSVDVNHSFYVPTLGGQINAIPGQHNHMWIQADEAGTFLGSCTELCGVNHAGMEIKIIALPQDQFDQWLSQQKQKTADASASEGE